MATRIYDSQVLYLVDGTPLYITPLKIKYLRQFMIAFENVRKSEGDTDTIQNLVECARITMQQYMPEIKTVEDLEDSFSLPTIYKLIDIAAGIKVDKGSDQTVKEQAVESGSSWETLDLAKLEAEVFLLGIWKDYNHLEESLSMPELIATLESKRESKYDEQKFLAAMQGVDLDKASNKSTGNAWEEMKARVYSGGKAANSKDVLALQGANAQRAGFGIGMGLDYQRID
jgi:hypothetical protein